MATIFSGLCVAIVFFFSSHAVLYLGICIVSAFYLLILGLMATIFSDLCVTIIAGVGFLEICVARANHILIYGLLVLAGHAATFCPLALAIDEMLAFRVSQLGCCGAGQGSTQLATMSQTTKS